MNDSVDKQAVLETNQAFYTAFANRELKSMNLVWWQGTTSVCIHPGGQILQGWEQIQASWSMIFRHTDSLEIDIEVLKVEIDQSLAYVVVQEMVLQSSQGRRVKAPSIATNIFQKMAQKWYLVSHHGSPIMR